MRTVRRFGIASAICVVATAIGLLAAPMASAGFGVNKWEAGTCKTDTPACTYGSPSSQFFTQAAGHPPIGLTDFAFNTKPPLLPIPGLLEETDGNVKDVRVDLPEGLNV